MTNPATRWSRPGDALRLIGSNPLEPAAVTSIVSTATGILREELQSLAASGVGNTPATLLPGALPGSAQLDGRVQPLVDALSQLLKVPAGQLTQLIFQTPSPSSMPGDGDGRSQSVRVLRTLQPVAAGEVTRLSLHLENDDDQPDECELYMTDLIGPSGSRLPASHVRVSPNPTRIAGHGSADVQIEVRIPSGTAAGWYTGLLQTDDGEDLRALVQVRVGQ
ncbi:MAG TPA: hypothetical protein VFS23_29345 [Vicinamibacterales bacterium]|nr:hypothetical protein [Vicinamibacterales bacterium]